MLKAFQHRCSEYHCTSLYLFTFLHVSSLTFLSLTTALLLRNQEKVPTSAITLTNQVPSAMPTSPSASHSQYQLPPLLFHPSNVKTTIPMVPPPRLAVKLGIQMEMLGLKSCKALASTCRLRHSLDGCLKFRRSRQSRRVRSWAEKKLKKGESELREVGC